MYCRKCGKKIPNDAKFCDFCGAEVLSEQPTQKIPQENNQQNLYQGQAGTGTAVAVRPKNKTLLIVIPVVLIIGLALFFVFRGFGKSDPLYGTWYIQLSELTGQPVSVTFTEDTITFGAGSIQNSKAMTLRYEKIGSDTLKIYSDNGDEPAVCTYQVKDDKLYLSSSTEKSLNIVFTRNAGDIKVPVN